MSVSSDSDAEFLPQSERTLALIKPEALEDAEAIENHIRNNGFIILAVRLLTSDLVAEIIGDGNISDFDESDLEERVWCNTESGNYNTSLQESDDKRQVLLTPEQAAELYKGHYGRHHFPHLVAHISRGPVIALVLAAHDAIQKWRTLMGPARVAEAQAYWPDSLRACYGRRTAFGEYFNALHGSDSAADALREIHFFFPTMVVGPLLRRWQVRDYIQKHITSVLTPGLTALAHERPAEPILWLAEYLRKHNPNEPLLAKEPRSIKEEARCHTPDSELSN